MNAATKRMLVMQKYRGRSFLPRRHIGSFRGDPGLLGSIGKVLGKIAPIAKAIPGVGTALSIASLGGSALGAAKGLLKAKQAIPTTTALAPYGLVGAGSQLAKATGGRLGGLALAGGAAAAGAGAAALLGGRSSGKRYRRMNPLNAKAARRAIARVKAVRKLSQDIERQLPKQRCGCGSKRGKR